VSNYFLQRATEGAGAHARRRMASKNRRKDPHYEDIMVTYYSHTLDRRLPVDRVGRAGALPSPVRIRFEAENVLSVSGFLLIQIKRRAGAFVTLERLRASFQPTSFGRGLETGAKEPRPASSAPLSREAGDRQARELQENKRPLLGRTRFEPISTRTGASPSPPRRLATPTCFEPILRLPFFRGRTAVASALISHPAIQRCGEHNTNTGPLSSQLHLCTRCWFDNIHFYEHVMIKIEFMR
jgi:hypothetical protein